MYIIIYSDYQIAHNRQVNILKFLLQNFREKWSNFFLADKNRLTSVDNSAKIWLTLLT